MKKFLGIILGVYCWTNAIICFGADKFDILPDLPEPLAATAAQASSVSTTDTSVLASQTIGHEPNILSILGTLFFVICLIYVTGIIYAKLNKAGLSALKRQVGDNCSHVTVISTTPLGSNKTLHVVELDGKRMLIGASLNSIHLIKDLGNYNPEDIEEGEFSSIEIPNIRIPKIEIPKIEIPKIGFTRALKNSLKQKNNSDEKTSTDNDKFEFSEIYEETDNSDGIIDKLFQTATQENMTKENNESATIEHQVDPDEFVLYKKYL